MHKYKLALLPEVSVKRDEEISNRGIANLAAGQPT